MTDTALNVTALRTAIEQDGHLTGRITCLGGISKFGRKFREHEFSYEEPMVALEVDTGIETIQFHIPVSKIWNNPIRSLFKNHNSFDGMLDETVYIFPDESFQNAQLCHRDSSPKGDEFGIKIQDSQRVKFRGEGCGLIRTLTVNRHRLERIIDRTFRRENNPHKWLEVDLKHEERDKEITVRAVDGQHEIDAKWSFDNNIQGTKRLGDFTDSLSAIHTLGDKSPNGSAWIKPIWDLEFSEVRTDKFISDNQYWVICNNPSENHGRSILKEVKQFLTMNRPRELVFAMDNVPYAKTGGHSDDWFVKV